MNKVISREYVEKNYIHKDIIIDLKLEREFYLQQAYEDFENDIEWQTYNKILEETKDENSNTTAMQEQKEQPTDINK